MVHIDYHRMRNSFRVEIITKTKTKKSVKEDQDNLPCVKYMTLWHTFLNKRLCNQSKIMDMEKAVTVTYKILSFEKRKPSEIICEM